MSLNVVTQPASPDDLVSNWATLREREPRLRQRDAAERLGVTEAELVAAHVGRGAIALAPAWRTLFEGLAGAGEVMALTRNPWIVSETHGRYGGVEFEGPHGIVVGQGIDLRAFPQGWRTAFGFTELVRGEPRTSLQIFDRYGVAVHKVFPTEGTDRGALDDLVARHVLADQARTLAVERPPAGAGGGPDPVEKTAALRDAWSRLEDTHDFFPMLRRLGVPREAALRMAGPAYAEPLTLDAHRRVVETASSTGLPIMVFVGNDGMIQIYTGPVKQTRVIGTWFNVLDPGFSLHLDETGVASAWRVRKPTRDGVVTSVELFDRHGKNLALFFGERKPGRPESLAWRALVEAMPRLG